MYITSQSIDIIILPIQSKYRNLISFYIFLSSSTYNTIILNISSTFRTISDSGIIFALIIKHNIENLRGKGKSIVFTHNFAYHILFIFLNASRFFLLSFPFCLEMWNSWSVFKVDDNKEKKVENGCWAHHPAGLPDPRLLTRGLFPIQSDSNLQEIIFIFIRHIQYASIFGNFNNQ